jgi:hypothetical protein
MESLFDRLDRDWQRLASSRTAAAALPEVLYEAGARDLAGVRHRTETGGPAAADRILALLAARAVEGDELAARVLLQLLLPGARRLARKWWALGSEAEREAAAVAAVYDRIRCYPIARRPAKIAANVLLDAAELLRRQVPSNGDAFIFERVDERVAVEEAESHPAVELLQIVRDAVAKDLIRRDDAELVVASRIAGRRMADLARERGAAVRTLQKHRKRAERVLVQLGAAA